MREWTSEYGIRSTFRPQVGTENAVRASRRSRQVQRRLYVAVLVVSDILMLALAFLLAYWLRFRTGLSIFELDVVPEMGHYQRLAFLLIGLWVLVFYLFRAYHWDNLLGGTQEYLLLMNASTLATVLVIAFGFIFPEFLVARGWLLSAWMLTILLPGATRFCLRRVVYRLRRRGYFMVPALIVGLNDEARALAQQLTAWETSGLHVLGFVGDSISSGERLTEELTVLGSLQALPDLIECYDVEEVIVAQSGVPSEFLLEIFRNYGAHEGINLRLSSGLFDLITTGLTVRSLAYVPLIGVNKMRLSRFEAFFKGCVDYVGSFLALVLLSPLLLGIAVAIKRDSPGPVIHRRHVLGRGGKRFDAYKFRTMYVDGDQRLTPAQRAELAVHHKLKNDPRITRVGQFLRKTSLDELPQLLNVLKGQMSLIGPRMITPAESAKYGKWAMNLLTVKPGLSGLWQVSGRSDVSYEERVNMDMHYIRNYTIWLDLELIVRTIAVVVNGKGAY